MSDKPIPPPRYTLWQAIAVAVSLSQRAIEEVRAAAAKPGPAGPPGPPGKLTGIKAWAPGVHYEGEPVTHDGSTWCALRDTAEPPPHDDWLLIAERGRDSPKGEVRGAYDAAQDYRQFDLVCWHGSEWRAKVDNPGELPGDGWALAAQRGSRGKDGERGLQGPPGSAAAAIVRWQIDEFRAVPVMSDGSTGPPLDLRALFEQYHSEAA